MNPGGFPQGQRLSATQCEPRRFVGIPKYKLRVNTPITYIHYSLAQQVIKIDIVQNAFLNEGVVDDF